MRLLSPHQLVGALLEDELPGEDLSGVDTDYEAAMADAAATQAELEGEFTFQAYPVDTSCWIKFVSMARRGRGRDGPEVFAKIDNNTFAYFNSVSEEAGIRLHRTNIIAVSKDYRVSVRTGGWETRTTLARISEYLPNAGTGLTIYQRNNLWWWGHRRMHEEPAYVGYSFPYTNGDYITADGILHGSGKMQYKKVRAKRTV